MARDVRDCAIMLEAMAGFDPKDSTSLDMPVPQWEAACPRSEGQAVGIPREYRMDGMDADVAASWDRGIAWLKDAGAEIVEISLPHTKYALPAYYIIAPAEASSNLARYDGVRYGLRDLPEGAGLQDMYAATRAAGFGAEVKRRILIGTYVLSAGFYDAYYTQAQKVRTLISHDFKNAFTAVRRDPRPDRADRRLSAWARRAPIRWRCTSTTCSRCPPRSPGSARDVGACRAQPRRPAAGPADLIGRPCVPVSTKQGVLNAGLETFVSRLEATSTRASRVADLYRSGRNRVPSQRAWW
jgi:hypothetical protein